MSPEPPDYHRFVINSFYMRPISQYEGLDQILSLLREETSGLKPRTAFPLLAIDTMASAFSPGNHFFYVYNTFHENIEYVHPTISNMLGMEPDAFCVTKLHQHMTRETESQLRLKENASQIFFNKRLPVEKRLLYKSSFTFRLENIQNRSLDILHQSKPIQLSSEGRVHRQLVIWLDMSYMNISVEPDTISFIGLEGEPSFHSLSIRPETLLEKPQSSKLSPRELDIVRLMSAGLASKQIGDRLSISTHTVDTHRRNLLKKTGTSNTLELAVVCVKRGWV